MSCSPSSRVQASGPEHTVNLFAADEGDLTRVDLLVSAVDG